jgi:hypothetical protein
MVANTGFSFSNMIFDQCWIKDDKIFFSGDFYPFKTYNEFTENSILAEFLSINLSDDESILKFIRKYGFILNLISTDKLHTTIPVGVHIDDDAIKRIEEDDIEIGVKSVTVTFKNTAAMKLSYDLYVFKNCYTRIKCLVELITGLAIADNSLVLINALFLALSRQPFDLDDNNWKTHALSYDLDAFANDLGNQSCSIQTQISNMLKSKMNSRDDLVFPLLLDILGELEHICTIEAISTETLIIFSRDVNTIIKYLSNETLESLLLFSRELVASEINLNLNNITPIIRPGHSYGFTGSWHIPDLLSSIYLDIYLKQSNSIIYKQCCNPSCGLFFEVNPDNKIKKYCSTRCAQLMAKRKQRERDKENSSGK